MLLNKFCILQFDNFSIAMLFPLKKNHNIKKVNQLKSLIFHPFICITTSDDREIKRNVFDCHCQTHKLIHFLITAYSIYKGNSLLTQQLIHHTDDKNATQFLLHRCFFLFYFLRFTFSTEWQKLFRTNEAMNCVSS